MPDGLAGIAERVRTVEFAGIPLGAAALGGGSALLLAEVTDAFITPRIPTVPAAAIKGGEAFLMLRYGHHVIGARGAQVATLFLTYDMIRTLVPLEQWIKDLIVKIPGGGGAATASGGGTTTQSGSGGNGHQPADAMSLLRDAVGGGA